MLSMERKRECFLAAAVRLYSNAVRGRELTPSRRRTHQSSPLGELFDHGVDALNTSLEVLLFAGSQNMGHGWRTVATLFACTCGLKFFETIASSSWADAVGCFLLIWSPALMTFYVQTWEEYHTHTLTLGIVNGPVEGILIVVSVYALTGYLGGASFWQQPMLVTLAVPDSILDRLPTLVRDLSFTDWYMVQGGLVLVYNTVESARTAIGVWNKENREAKDRRSRREHPILGLLPFFATWLLVVAYLALQPEILHAHLVPFVLFVGIVNAYSVGQMITAHVSHLPFPYYNVLVLPLAWGVVDSLGPLLQRLEPTVARQIFGASQPPAGFVLGWPSALGDGVYQVAFMFCMLGAAIGVYGSFVVDVIVTICDYLDIWCLTIKHPYVEGAEKKAAGKARGNASKEDTSYTSATHLPDTAAQRTKQAS